jgi:dolichyl-phosphate beta-glucosyltransferase
LRTEDFTGFASEHPTVGFVFVNDGSTDDTLRILRDLCASAPQQFRYIDAEHGGKGKAVRHGLEEAMRNEGVRYVGYWDADLSTPLDAIVSLTDVLDRLPNVTLAMGARVQLLGRSIRRSALRHYLGRVFATAASVILSLPVYDTQCGAKLFRVGPETRHIFAEPFATRWVFDVEIIARMRQFERASVHERIHEVPLQQWHDAQGSKRRPWHYVTAARDLVTVLLKYR